MRKKILILLAIILLASAALVFVLNNPFGSKVPVKSESTDEVGQYLKVNSYVSEKLSGMAATLPESVPSKAKNVSYHYEYEPADSGEASFYIRLHLEFGSEADKAEEIHRLRALKPESAALVGDTTYLLFECSPDGIAGYLDDKVYDGLNWHFNIVAVNTKTQSLDYTAAFINDGGPRPAELTKLVETIKNRP